jgi:ABC-type sugar transport system ATPase subunit
MARVELMGVKKKFGNVDVIHGLDIDISDGEFVVFVGPSGCGKSTALRTICGLETISAGDIRIDGKSVKNVPPAKRGAAMVFQSYALYPHMTVAMNMGFSLRMAGVPAKERAERVLEAAKILKLESYLDRKPRELSGGQRQRVAIGRAIVRKPSVFLFDEPLSNLDAELRVQMRFELARLHRELRTTMIYVTHDQVEAMTLADRIVVMRNGRVEQIGAPMELYRNPANVFVAGFIGSPRMNFLRANVRAVSAGIATVDFEGLVGGSLSLPVCDQIQPGETLTLGIRPEHIRVGDQSGCRVEAALDFVEQLGGMNYAYASGFAAGALIAAVPGSVGEAKAGQVMHLGFSAEDCFLFDSDGEIVSRPGSAPKGTSLHVADATINV